MQRTVTLPTALTAGAWTLALLASPGTAEAQIFVLQGEAGLACWDLDEDRSCDLASEDTTGDGLCSALDCQPASALTCVGDDCTVLGNLAVGGGVAVVGDVSAGEVAVAVTTLAELEGRVDQLESTSALASDLAALDAQVARELKVDTTWTTPGDYPTLEDAWAAAADWRIHPDATLTIDIVGTHAMTGPLELFHPDGDRIHLIGASVTSGVDVLDFPDGDGLLLASGHIGSVDRLVIQGVNNAGNIAVYVHDNASIRLDSELVIQDFAVGILAERSSNVWAPGVTVIGALAVAFQATYGSSLHATGAVSDGAASGFRAIGGSYVWAEAVTVLDADTRAFLSFKGSTIEAHGATATCTGTCITLRTSSVFAATDFTATIDTVGGDSEGSVLFVSDSSAVQLSGAVTLEGEDGPILNVTDSSSLQAVDATLIGQGAWIARSQASSSIVASGATLAGGYSGSILVSGSSFADWSGVTNPSSAAPFVETGSDLNE